MNKDLSISILNLVYVREDYDSKDAFDRMIDLAQHLDHSSYKRYWISEHHNMRSIASSATRQLIHYTASKTEKIRVGSGGVMLPNHTPYVVAEDFGTMYEIYGDRFDIGLGRAPGTDMMTARAIRRDINQGVFNFKDEIKELQFFLSDQESQVIANPGSGTNIPLYVLGSSTDSAYIAAELGLPYAFASHFAPKMMKEAFEIYERNFQPSEQLDKPYKMATLNVIMADTDEEAEVLASSHYQNILSMIKHERAPMKKPVEDMSKLWSTHEQFVVHSQFPIQVKGSKETAKKQLEFFQQKYEVDELIIASAIYDTDAWKKSYDLFEEVVDELKES